MRPRFSNKMLLSISWSWIGAEMADPRKTCVLIAYAPALVRGDRRTLAATHAMERAVPGLRLDRTISDDGTVLALPQRDAWLTDAAARMELPMLCNGDEDALVTFYGLDGSAGSSPGGLPVFEIHAEVPPAIATTSSLRDALVSVSEAADAFWARVLPEGLALIVARQFHHRGNEPHLPPRGLPSLKLPWELRSPDVPHYLGWLNYWSAATARLLGFPDATRDAELLTRSRRTASGGWLVQLTEAPLDLDDPAHLDALLRAYARFPEIGGRAPFAAGPVSR
ncbi:DUF5953 family protein [Corallococcus interemptor]|uniref:DUF5953 family protein n=1 Tax=Corallococcus interemptor TaxID=2316720 RepID=UPI0035D40F38